MIQRFKLYCRLWIACGSIAFLGLLSSCDGDTPTGASEKEPPEGVTIDPNGETDFFLGSTTAGGSAEGRIEVWGHNLRIVHRARVMFDVVLINQSNEPVYPLVLFYVTQVVPASIRVANFDSRGFGDSFVFDFSHDLGSDDRLEPGERSGPRAMGFDVPEIMAFAIGFRITTGGPPVDPDCPAPYPTTIPPLPPETLESLRAEFRALNPNICSDLNRYGFTEGFCLSFPNPLPDDADVERLISEARATLAENVRFTGVAESSSLVVSSHTLFGGQLRVHFGRQVFEGLEVIRSNLSVQVDAGGVRSIDGNHYLDVCVPPKPLLPPIPAQESIIGLEIVWYDFGGFPRVHTVTERDLQDPPTRVILPHERGGSIELRVAWRIPVGQPDAPGWYVYVDTMDRELLWIEQLFRT